MPRRFTPLVNGEYYHIFNRGVNKQPIFNGKRDYMRAIETVRFYLSVSPPIRYSKFLRLAKEQREKIFSEMIKQKKICEVVTYCFLPNHFHFLLRQNLENGVSRFMKLFQTSYNMFFNLKYDRAGPLLQGQFKAIRVEDNNQLLHLSRYIHLNPFTSYLVKDFENLKVYPWSSFGEYIKNTRNNLCSKETILTNFKDIKGYEKFVFNNLDYQKRLRGIKHLLID